MMQEIYDETLELMIKQLAAGHDPLEVAAVLSTISLGLYKSLLPQDSYDLMVDAISDNRNKIKALTDAGKTLQ